MGSAPEDSGFRFEISLSVLNHLGRNLYRNFITVLGEAISNAWDADARNVWIQIDRGEAKFIIKDDGVGMSAEDFQDKFLHIGYSKRKDAGPTSGGGRPFIGAKGIGKLALLSCAERISVFTKTEGPEYVGGVIDNRGLDEAIKHDLEPDKYPLEQLDFSLIEGFTDGHDHGTIVVFEGAKEILTNSVEQIRKLLAMTFRFSIIDENFTIHVNGEPVSVADLKGLADATEFIWIINGYKDEFTERLSKLEADPIKVTTALPVEGFIATVRKPRDLKITGTEGRATIDLFANGRLREKHVIRHIPTQRVPESYMYGQLHYDILDQKGDDPFTSSREGILESDPDFQKLLEYLKGTLLRQIIEEDWDKLRLDRGKEGDDENTRVSKKLRKAAGLYVAAQEEFRLDEGAPGRVEVDRWFGELLPDAQFNLACYADCFLSENLIRRFISEKGQELVDAGKGEVAKFRKQEDKTKGKANISFDIRAQGDDLSFVGMDNLAWTAEGSKTTDGQQSLWADAVNYNPVRNAVAHTALLTKDAKDLLNLTLRNIKGRLKTLLSKLAE